MSYDAIKVGHYELLTDTVGRVIVVDRDGDRSWTYRWPAKNRGSHRGETVAEWVAGCSVDYVAGKFGANRWFDAEGTIASVCKWICEERRAGDLEKDDARELWDSLDDVREEQDWSRWLAENDSYRTHVSDAWEHTTYGIEPVFRRAFDVLWPELRARAAASREARARAVAVDLPPLPVDQLTDPARSVVDQLHDIVNRPIVDTPVFAAGPLEREEFANGIVQYSHPNGGGPAFQMPLKVEEYLKKRGDELNITASWDMQSPPVEVPPGVEISRKLLLQLRDWVPEFSGYRAVLREIDAALGGTPDGREER